MLHVAIPKETVAGERRVAVVPEAVGTLTQAGCRALIEAGAGADAFCPDRAYEQAGAELVREGAVLWQQADVVLKVQLPSARSARGHHEADVIKAGAVVVCLPSAQRDPALIPKLLEKRVTSFALERLPRISRAQGMDALSSQSTVAGYCAVLLAAQALPRFFPLLMTAAGTIPPARVFVLGAGVAGLQAIATARRLGAQVEAFDVRPEVREQVESLGARFVGAAMEEATGAGGYAKALSEEARRREQAVIQERLREADCVITTALVPGKRAPVLVTAQMVTSMKPGSVIVDLAAEQGGNCELTKPDQPVRRDGITILGPTNLPSAMPHHASHMYARNITRFLVSLIKGGALRLDFEDEITRATCVTHDGQLRAQEAA